MIMLVSHAASRGSKVHFLHSRQAAIDISCAPSTLSVRIKKAEAAEDEARRRAGLPAREPAEAVSCLDKRLARGLGPALVGVVNVPA